MEQIGKDPKCKQSDTISDHYGVMKSMPKMINSGPIFVVRRAEDEERRSIREF